MVSELHLEEGRLGRGIHGELRELGRQLALGGELVQALGDELGG